jgi:uncharacterized SAM-binding protein YcdF (DUF218 family)
MFFYASKILQFLFNPISWIFILLLLAILLKNNTFKKRFLLAAIAVFFIFSNSFIFSEVARKWEVSATKYEDLKKHELAIVLGGSTVYDAQLKRMQANNSIDRVLQALELYHKGYVGKILFTGGAGSLLYPDMKEGLYIQEYLLNIGFPAEDLIIESKSRNTIENAEFTKNLLEQMHWWKNQEFLLITSGYHMPRSLKVFENLGMQPVSYSVSRFAGERRYDPAFLLIPNAEVLKNWELLIHEWIGISVYYLFGYV